MPKADLGGRCPSVAFPTLVFRYGVVCAARLPEIRFEGLVGLTPPLSYSLPLRTGRVFSCAGSYSTAISGVQVGPKAPYAGRRAMMPAPVIDITASPAWFSTSTRKRITP